MSGKGDKMCQRILKSENRKGCATEYWKSEKNRQGCVPQNIGRVRMGKGIGCVQLNSEE